MACSTGTSAPGLHPPRHNFVIEDADVGVQAAKAGNMVAIGLARADDEELLAAADANLVVTSLDDVDLAGARGRPDGEEGQLVPLR